jgi:xanthine dehydrogenase accessory factor
LQSLNSSVIAAVYGWLTAGRTVWLATIVETVGSSPRPAGSLLAISDAGQWIGSVSGGCLEEDLIQRLLGDADSDDGNWPRLIDYGIEAHDQDRFRLPCGGRIRLLVEKLVPAKAREHFHELQQKLQARQRLVRKVDIATGQCSVESLQAMAEIELDELALRHKMGPETRLLIIGTGEVSRYVARFALANEFVVTLCEPRDIFREGWDEPAVEIVQQLPDDLVMERFADTSSAVVALAHDPRIDDMALLAALNSSAFYIGAMGSRRTTAQRRQRLYELGIAPNQLNRLHAPIGFDIGSKAPAEIAIAILAQLLAERHRLLRLP